MSTIPSSPESLNPTPHGFQDPDPETYFQNAGLFKIHGEYLVNHIAFTTEWPILEKLKNLLKIVSEVNIGVSCVMNQLSKYFLRSQHDKNPIKSKRLF